MSARVLCSTPPCVFYSMFVISLLYSKSACVSYSLSACVLYSMSACVSYFVSSCIL